MELEIIKLLKDGGIIVFLIYAAYQLKIALKLSYDNQILIQNERIADLKEEFKTTLDYLVKKEENHKGSE